MGVCCCGRSTVAAAKASARRDSEDYHEDVLPTLNPFSNAAAPFSAAGFHTLTKTSIDAARDGSTGSEAHDGPHGAYASRLRHRRGAICGESLSRYLHDVRWWVKDTDGERRSSSDLPDALRAEREVVRRVLLAHPFFSDCGSDVHLLDDVLDAFQRRETLPGAVIAAPGDVAAFHVVVKGGAVADASHPVHGSSAVGLEGEDATEREELGDGRRPLHGDSGRWDVGEAFGNEGLLYPLSETDRGALVRAADGVASSGRDGDDTSATVTWCLSRVRYQQLLRLHYDDQLRRVLRALSQCPLFDALSSDQLFRLSERASVVQHEASVALLRTGETPTDLLVVLSGTVAVEHERANGHGGVAHIQAAILSPGDCVGDVEWLSSADRQHGGACPSAYTYTTQQPPFEAVHLSLRDIANFLSAEDFAAMQCGSRGVQAGEAWKVRVRESLRALVEQSLLANISDSEGDSDSDGDDDEKHLGLGGVGGQAYVGTAASRSSPLPLIPGSRAMLMDDVTVKGADVTNFLLKNLFCHPTYCLADGRERGLSMAAFTARRSYPQGTVLFDVVYATRSSKAASAAVAEGVSQSGATPADTEDVLSVKADRLYVVVSGAISVVDTQRSGAGIFVVSRGSSVGEEGLLPPLRCSTAAPLHTRAVVTSEGGCDVYELNARTFREFLRRPYTAGLRAFCGTFCVLPYAEYFPENYWRFLFHCATEREVVGGDLLGVRGAPCGFVSLLLDGQVKAYHGGDGSSTDSSANPPVASFGPGDIVGSREAVEGTVLAVAYVCECRTRLLCVPAESFAGLFWPAMAYLRTLWSQPRYEAVR